MRDVKFDLKPIEEKPRSKYRKGSKYDAVLDEFLEGASKLVEVSVDGKEANYLRLQLSKRIEARKIGGVKVSVVNGVVYLEKE